MKKRLLISVGVVAFTATLGTYALWRQLWPRSSSEGADAAENRPAADEPRTKVVLTPEKFSAMKLSYAEVTKRPLQSVRTVPGKIEYRSVHFVELKAPVDLVVQKVLVKPGTNVEPGTKLAILTSPDIGMARSELEKAESELKIANQAFEWADEITLNLGELLKFLGDRPSSEVVEQEFDSRLLGNHRQDILPAYSKHLLAEKQWIGAEQALKKGAIADQRAAQYESNYQVAKAHYLSVREQSRFDSRQARERAMQNQKFARAQVEVKRRTLRTMLGEYSKITAPGDSTPEGGADLTLFSLISPLAGTVEQRSAADSQRVAEGAPLFRVANTDTLEVRADIFEGVWQSVSLAEGQMLNVVVPAVSEDREFEARIDYVGRAVDAQTRAVPLVALLDNSKHEFKPGMFARITIPSGAAGEEIVIPAAALCTHEHQEFVFGADEDDPRTFHRLDVVVGRRTPEWVSVTSGLAAGQRVVVDGAFLLKNELLLERGSD